MDIQKKPLLVGLLGVIVGGLSALLLFQGDKPTYGLTLDDHDEFHVHADLLVYVNGEKIDLTDDKYQSTTESIKHDHLHLHDHEGSILHRHHETGSFGEFLQSIGFELTNTCLITDEKIEYCDNEDNELSLYVNGEKVDNASDYIFNDEDQMLLYYGEKNSPVIQSYIEEITDEACIYSGTCPERGLPPPESCGLTCDI